MNVPLTGEGVVVQKFLDEKSRAGRIGVLLMTYGSPATADDVPAYLTRIRRGQPPSPELIAEFQRRYQVVGGSPLLERTEAQAAALVRVLQPEVPDIEVAAGMRFAPPFIGDAIKELRGRGVQRLVGIIMSPQYSATLMGGYHQALDQALAGTNLGVRISGAWHRQPLFIQALAIRVREALDRFPANVRARVPVLLSAHSIPRTVADREPDYVEQLHETAEAVAAAAGLDGWRFAYQSAGHTREEWLKPDLKDIIPVLKAEGHDRVLVAPIQFLADHLEILYDIDVAARAEAEEAGVEFYRTESLNDLPLFIDALAALVREEIA